MTKTDELIALLSQDSVKPASLRQETLRALLWLVPITLLSTYAVSELTNRPFRQNYLTEIQTLPVLTKQLLPLMIALSLIPMVIQLCRPEGRIGRLFWWSIAAVSLVNLTIIIKMVGEPSDQWINLVLGGTFVECFVGVSFISSTVLIGGLTIAHKGACVRPTALGFLLGVFSGGIGSFIYAFLCMNDNPLFYGVWYSLAALGVGLLGAILGNRLLRW